MRETALFARRHLRCSAIGIVLLAACSSPTNPDGVGARWVWRENCPGAYPPQETSPYVLPYEPGQSFVVGGGNCGGGHRLGTWEQYAYDIQMPIGTRLVAARDGEVIRVEERFANGTRISGQENGIEVRHTDGTIAGYWHLTTNGALVEVGDRVEQGQIIALSGDSGNSLLPHLHFEVLQGCSFFCSSIPVTFRNTRPHPRGLIKGESYRAE
jgi:murein DD-endopeptidase MepM/ murein hydrolase activator NlpD